MVLLESIKIPLGSPLPEFELKDATSRSYKSRELFGERGLLVVFTCNHCPYAQAVWPRVIRLANYAKNMKISSAAINPNINPDYPDDSPAEMLKKIKEWGIDFPYLVDENQDVARKFKAQCTPDIYLFDAKKQLVYHGRIDDNWKEESKVTKEELKEALNHLATNQPISSEQRPSMGCSIKWRQ